MRLALLLCLSALALLALTGRLAFLVNEFPQRLRRLVAVVLFAGVLLTAVFLPTATGGKHDIDVETLWLPSIFAGHVVLTVFLFLWWRLRPSRESLSRFLLLDRVRWEDVRQGMWIGTVGWMVTIVATAGVAVVVHETPAAPAPTEIPEVMVWLATLPVAYKLLVIAIAMTVEEGFFRAFLQSRIGWIPSSILFALGHAGYGLPMMLFSVFVISLIIGWTLHRGGRLLPCIVAHGVFDAIQLLIILPAAVKMIDGG